MRRTFLAFLLCVTLATTAGSQDPPEMVKWVIPPPVIHKNIHFILDRSGSMNPDQLASAMGCFLMIASQSVDEINIAITVFGKNAERWDGLPDDNTPKQWAALPSQTALDAAKEWLATVDINDAETRVETAIRTIDTKIIRPGNQDTPGGHDIDEVSVIVISDLELTNWPQDLLGAVNTIRRAREANQAHDFNLGFVGIKTNTATLAAFRKVSRQHGFWLAFIGDCAPPGDEEEVPDEPDEDEQMLPDPAPPLPPLPDPSPY